MFKPQSKMNSWQIERSDNESFYFCMHIFDRFLHTGS